MNQIQELMEKRKLAWEGAKAFVESKKDKDGLMSDEDAKTYSDMEKRLSINDIDKLYTLALHLVDIIDMAPFKSKK